MKKKMEIPKYVDDWLIKNYKRKEKYMSTHKSHTSWKEEFRKKYKELNWRELPIHTDTVEAIVEDIDTLITQVQNDFYGKGFQAGAKHMLDAYDELPRLKSSLEEGE